MSFLDIFRLTTHARGMRPFFPNWENCQNPLTRAKAIAGRMLTKAGTQELAANARGNILELSKIWIIPERPTSAHGGAFDGFEGYKKGCTCTRAGLFAHLHTPTRTRAREKSAAAYFCRSGEAARPLPVVSVLHRADRVARRIGCGDNEFDLYHVLHAPDRTALQH